MTRQAWIESPLQLINAVEYSVAADDAVDVALRAGVPHLQDTANVLASHLPQGVTMRGSCRSAARSPFMGARARLIGDAYSGQFRAVVTATGVRDLVIVGDGTASLALASQLAEGAGLSRMGQRERPLARLLGLETARRLRRAMAHGSVEAFSVYATDPRFERLAELGARVRPNRYLWLKSLRLPSDGAPQATSVVLGTALVDDALLDAGRYLGWLRTLLDRHGPIAYLPHRREKDETLARYRALPGLEVVHRSGLPAEIAIHAHQGLRRVITLPSSAVATLSVVLPESVDMIVAAIPESWWTPAADKRVRTVLGGARPLGGRSE